MDSTHHMQTPITWIHQLQQLAELVVNFIESAIQLVQVQMVLCVLDLDNLGLKRI